MDACSALSVHERSQTHATFSGKDAALQNLRVSSLVGSTSTHSGKLSDASMPFQYVLVAVRECRSHVFRRFMTNS